MKKNFKLVTLLTLFTIVLNVLSVLVLMKPSFALVGGKDTASRLTVGATGVTHTITVTGVAANTDNVEITFPSLPYSFGGTLVGTTTGSCTTLGLVVTCTGWNGVADIVVSGVTNPSTVSNYMVQVVTGRTGHSQPVEMLKINMPIVDSDTVNVEGYITSSLYFDLDTNTDNGDCAYDACYSYARTDGTPTAAANYTVDLGHLTTMAVNRSGGSVVKVGDTAASGITVLHQDLGNGPINSIYFDLSSNAVGGVVLSYKSAYGELRGPGHNVSAASDLDIPTVVSGEIIEYNKAAYGIQLINLPDAKSFGVGTRTVNCGTGTIGDYFCVMGVIVAGDNTQAAAPIYTTTGAIEAGRGRIDVAAAIDGTNVPGLYTDQITFIATSTF
jgi:hypothetical protein